MHVTATHQHVPAEHGVVCSFETDFFGYFGWPTVARMENGRLLVAASGLRNAHVCPFGRTVICTSANEGTAWTTPTVINDLPLDDRDAGIIPLGGDKLLVSWFSTDTRLAAVYDQYRDSDDEATVARYASGFARITDAAAARWVGSWVRTSDDGGDTWSAPIRAPVTAPHGPIRLRSGDLLYLGKTFLTDTDGHRRGVGAMQAASSADGGRTWTLLGVVPLIPGTTAEQYHEAHVVELTDGRLVGLIRLQNHGDAPKLEPLGLVHFSLAQTESADGGQTWTPAQPLGFHGSPPHLMRHSSGALVCVYGYRLPPYGQRAMISRDGGRTWQADIILRDDGPDGDLGYPSSVELADGSLLTVYYQKVGSAEDKCSLLWTRWELPE
jgi:Neuraminidase (sialidase)